MRRALGLAALVAAASCGGGSSVPAIDAVRVTVDGCGLAPEIATGFRLAGGLVVTAAHPLSGDGPIAVDGAAATVVALDERADVGVLRVDGGAGTAELRAPRQGDAVVVARLTRKGPSRDPAHVTSVASITFHDVVAGTAVTREGFIVDLAIVGGDSGSPVIGADGRVLGIMFANAHETDATSYAVSSTEITKVLDAARDGTAPTSRPPC